MENTPMMTPESPAQRVERLVRNKTMVDGVRLAQARVILERSRRACPDIWSDEQPLISVRIATYNRPQLLVERAIASVFAQTYRNFEIVVVGDHAVPETAEAIERLNDPRVRYHNLPTRPAYPTFPRFFWMTAGSYAMTEALDRCRGNWIAPLDDDDEFSPDHLEVLLQAARERQLEMVYGVLDSQMPGDQWAPIGREPLVCGGICHASVLFHRRLAVLRHDPDCWLLDEPGDWNLWKRMAMAGGRIGFVDRVVGRHYAEFSSVDPVERQRLFEKQPTPEEVLTDAAATGAAALLDMA
jgi:glycosyltransferase involved in cell wall biosynthesis